MFMNIQVLGISIFWPKFAKKPQVRLVIKTGSGKWHSFFRIFGQSSGTQKIMTFMFMSKGNPIFDFS